MNQRGQSFIESAVALPVALVGVSAFFVLIWGIAVSLAVHHQLYEMLVCNEIYPRPTTCYDSAKQSIQRLVIFGQLHDIDYVHEFDQSRATAKITLPLNLPLRIHEILKLPLESP